MSAASLPTPWLSGVPNARVACMDLRSQGQGRLQVQLPAAFVPVRRYCAVSLREVRGGVLIAIDHGDPFTMARPGMNAWQAEQMAYLGGDAPVRVRMLERRWDRIAGERAAFRRLRNLLHSHPEGLDALVRVTPNGFMLMVGDVFEGDRIEPLTVHNDPVPILRHYQDHGAPSGTPRPSHPNCRCTVKTKETDMRKIDTTTNDDLPFGLIAGETIVRCQFSDGASQDYGSFAGGLDLAEGDYVVVASPRAEYSGGSVFDEESGGYLKVVRVVSVEPTPEAIQRAAKWVIGKVDVTEYRDRRKKLEELKTLDAQIKVARQEAIKALELQKLRELSPELDALIAKRFALTGSQPAAPKEELVLKPEDEAPAAA